MAVDWGLAGQIGGMGFGIVFAVLTILAVERSLKLAKEIIEVPITGKIISVETKVGDMVQEGDVICFIESMKMENPILAPVAGKIIEIKVSAGQVVESGSLLAIIEY